MRWNTGIPEKNLTESLAQLHRGKWKQVTEGVKNVEDTSVLYKPEHSEVEHLLCLATQKNSQAKMQYISFCYLFLKVIY